MGFANVLIKNSTIGTTTNADGYYELELKEGAYDITYQYIGYEKQTIQITMLKSMQKNIFLKPVGLDIQEVVIQNDINPALRIIKNTIAARKSNKESIQDFECNFYIKGLNRMLESPQKFMGTKIEIDGVDSLGRGVIYFSECVSKYYFKQKNKYKENVISSKVSGDDNGISFNRAMFFNFNLYDEDFSLFDFSPRGLVTPIADNALFYYDYELKGSFIEDGRLIYEVRFLPKRKFDPCFQGTLYIVDNTWNLHSTDLIFQKNENINFLDSVHIKQLYAATEKNVWVLISQQFYFKATMLMFKVDGNYDASYTDYKINTNIADDFFTNEIVKVEKDATLRDSVYWNSIRPMPLTQDEKKDYIQKDSIKAAHLQPAYLDSMRREHNKPTWNNLIVGYSYQLDHKNTKQLSINGLLSMIEFNTVQGWKVALSPSFSHQREDTSSSIIRSHFAYGFSNSKLDLGLSYTYNRFQKWKLSLDFYDKIVSLDETSMVLPLYNTFSSLLQENNFLKLYHDQAVSATLRTRLHHTLVSQLDMSMHRRKNVSNTTSYIWKDNKNKSYTPNIFLTNSDPVLKAKLSLKYQPGVKYMSYPNQKIYFTSSYPIFHFSTQLLQYLGAKKSFATIQSLRIEDNISLKKLGTFYYDFAYGFNVNDQNISAADRKYFVGNQYIGLTPETRFVNLPFYTTPSGSYVEAHVYHDFKNFLSNKIPLLRKLKINNKLGINSFYVNKNEYYYEPYIASNFKYFPLDIYCAWSFHESTYSGFRLGIMLPLSNESDGVAISF